MLSLLPVVSVIQSTPRHRRSTGSIHPDDTSSQYKWWRESAEEARKERHTEHGRCALHLTTPGHYHVLPAHAAQLYEPEVFGHTAEASFGVW